MGRGVWSSVIAVAAMVCSVGNLGAQAVGSEEKAKASFNLVVKRCNDAYAAKKPERVAEIPSGGFVRVGSSEVKLSYDITRTQSLVSPLLGVVVAEVTAYATKRMGTKEEAETAPIEPTGLMKQKLSFALQDGVWVYKSSTSETYPIRDGVTGRRDMVLTSDPTPGTGPVPGPSYVCAFGAK